MFKSAKIVITGIVQGVNFRYDIRNEAAELNLSGYTKNLPAADKIEVVAEGEREIIDKLIDWIKSGNHNAKVKGVEIEWQKGSGEYHDFKIEY